MTDERQFAPGDRVRVKSLHPPGHVRTPWFTRGKTGEIIAINGSFGNPETLAYGGDGMPRRPLYRVRFAQSDLWTDYSGAKGDTLVADIFEHWLEPAHE